VAKILLIEDDPSIVGAVNKLLQTEQFDVDTAATLSEANAHLDSFSYDLLVIDWELPDGSGVDLCRNLRRRGVAIPTLILTGRSQISDKEQGLGNGADDYVTKPFDGREFVARVKALLRRPATYVGSVLKRADLQLDSSSKRVTRSGRDIDLQPHEIKVLEFLMRNPDIVFSTDQLMRHCWSSEQEVTDEAVYTCIRRLRKKITQEGEKQLITTVHGSGYRFDAQ
jgi:DNA-binding response OmpR family regulator